MNTRFLQMAALTLALSLTGFIGCSAEGTGCGMGSSPNGQSFCGPGTRWDATTSTCVRQ